MPFGQLRRFIATTRESVYPVVNDDFRLTGILSLRKIRPVIFEESIIDLLILRDLVLPPVSVSLDESLSEALLKFLGTGFGRIPIEDKDMGVIGMLWLEDLLARYHLELEKLRMDETLAD